jgi:alkanesulfonate monooxygenase
MPVEFIGMIGTRPASEASGPQMSIIGGSVDRNFVREFARAHEDGGFDRVLIGYGSAGPDGWQVAAYCAANTDRLGYLLAHRPGFVAPTLAARMAATLDHFCDGRIALHIITGGSDAEQQRDGDFFTHDERYERTDEYLTVMRQTWTSAKPFDHEGRFYHFANAYADVKPLQQPHVPLYFGGSSEAALRVGAKHADVYAMWGERLDDVRAFRAQVLAAAAQHGRTPGISVSVRPILGNTEDEAWEKARGYLATIEQNNQGRPASWTARTSEGSQRLLRLAANGELHDKRLWTPIAAATGASGNTTALVGTPDQVAEALVDYWDAGATTLLIRGFDPYNDAIAYGRDLLPLVRQEVAHRERQAVAV